MPIPETTKPPEAVGLYAKRRISVTVNVFNRLESLYVCLCCQERSRTLGHRATQSTAPALSPWLLGDMNPSMSHMWPWGQGASCSAHPPQNRPCTNCFLQDLIFLVSSGPLDALALNQPRAVRWQILNKVICNSGYLTLCSNRLDSTITNLSCLQIGHLRHMLQFLLFTKVTKLCNLKK